jgi:hypothetical protein
MRMLSAFFALAASITPFAPAAAKTEAALRCRAVSIAACSRPFGRRLYERCMRNHHCTDPKKAVPKKHRRR